MGAAISHDPQWSGKPRRGAPSVGRADPWMSADEALAELTRS
jgi:hypothetical protein